jgi:hypothetical protein
MSGPDLTDKGNDDVPWGSGPLIKNASGRLLYIDMKLNCFFSEGWRYCVKTATANGLVAFRSPARNRGWSGSEHRSGRVVADRAAQRRSCLSVALGALVALVVPAAASPSISPVFSRPAAD